MLLTLVVLYLLITIAVGLWAAKRVKNTADFAIAGRNLPLVIVGDGPLREMVQAAAQKNPAAIRFVGEQSHERALELIGHARLLVMPSVWYETFGRTLIEAFAKGTPVLASRMGAMCEIVSPCSRTASSSASTLSPGSTRSPAFVSGQPSTKPFFMNGGAAAVKSITTSPPLA